MQINYNELQNVNDYIKDNKLQPTIIETLMGKQYNELVDITYLVVDIEKNTYTSYCNMIGALIHKTVGNKKIAICKGEIK